MKRVFCLLMIIIAAVCSGCISEPENTAYESDDSGYGKIENGIPVVYLTIDEQGLHQDENGTWFGSIDDMNESDDHSIYCTGTVSIVITETFIPVFVIQIVQKNRKGMTIEKDSHYFGCM